MLEHPATRLPAKLDSPGAPAAGGDTALTNGQRCAEVCRSVQERFSQPPGCLSPLLALPSPAICPFLGCISTSFQVDRAHSQSPGYQTAGLSDIRNQLPNYNKTHRNRMSPRHHLRRESHGHNSANVTLLQGPRVSAVAFTSSTFFLQLDPLVQQSKQRPWFHITTHFTRARACVSLLFLPAATLRRTDSLSHHAPSAHWVTAAAALPTAPCHPAGFSSSPDP